jgi:hypothetical protein
MAYISRTRYVAKISLLADGRAGAWAHHPPDRPTVRRFEMATPADTIGKGYEAFSAGDVETVMGLFSPAIVWEQGGTNGTTKPNTTASASRR